MSILPDRLSTIGSLVLSAGAHSPDGEMCVMEAVAFVAGEPWSDHPACASKVIGAFLRTWNDQLDHEDRQKLKPYIPKLVGSAGSVAVETARSWLALDWLARTQAPAWLDLVNLADHAAALRAAEPITSQAAARTAQPALDAAEEAAREAATAAAWEAGRGAAWEADTAAAWGAVRGAAWEAAWEAATAAAWEAVRGAAWEAAREAVRGAAWEAAREAVRGAAGGAAREAAREAAWDALKPTVLLLQASAFELLDAMLAL